MAPGAYARKITIRLLAVLVALCLLPGRPHAALIYKNYIIQQDGGRDILCAPYTVKSGDWVSKILRLRGEIARQDFPLFLEIFQLINPHVKDINRIRPGQQIIIPLRIVESGSLQGQQQGLVTIPFVDLSTRMGVRPSGEQAVRYRVKTGDSLSKLVAAQFGRYGTTSYREGVRLLKELNPQVKDMDQIFVGQVIFLPTPGMADSGGPIQVPSPAVPDTTRYRHLSGKRRHAGERPPEAGLSTLIAPLSEAAARIGAHLLQDGIFSFPGAGGGTTQLDFSKTPLLEMPDGRKVILTENQPIDPADWAAIERRWKRLRQVSVPARASADAIIEAVLDTPGQRPDSESAVRVEADGIEFVVRAKWTLKGPSTNAQPIRHICITMIDSPAQRTPTGITRYLERYGVRISDIVKQSPALRPKSAHPVSRAPAEVAKTVYTTEHRQFIPGLLAAMGYTFTRNATVSFPYAGIEVKAISNLVNMRSGNPLFIDFGDLHGDAFDAVRNTGFRIIQFLPADTHGDAIDKLLGALEETYDNQPSFLAADRPKRYNTEIRIPGNLIGAYGREPKTLITARRLTPPLQRLLQRRHVRVVSVVPIPRGKPAAAEPKP